MEIECMPDQCLSNSEKYVVDFINAKQRVIRQFSINDIAEGSFVSNATVSRAIRKCGFESLPELKFRLTHEDAEQAKAHEINKILSKSYMECLETIKSIQIDSVIRVADMLRAASRVYILSCGLTALIADEFAFQLQCQKINSIVISDSMILKKMNLLVEEEDLVIILSVQNSTPELAIGGQLAKQAGLPVIGCCCKKGTPLDGICDIVLYGYTQSITPNQAFGGTSRLGLSIITRTIIEYLTTNM